ncbi:MAG: hypothetical protein WA294_16455 [Acidobacteriaceae bacterium]
MAAGSSTPATPIITWPVPAPIAYGAPLSNAQLDATANVPGTFAYSPSAGSILKAGSQTLSATFTPADTTRYSTATAFITLTVSPATPVLTWSAPAPITYGTPLSDTQLDAAASVAGSFAYTPAAGTVLPSGTQTLSVLFTPSDAVDYTTAAATATLTIAPAGCSGPVSPAARTIQIANDSDDGYYNSYDGTGWHFDPQYGGADLVGSSDGDTTAWAAGFRFPSTGIQPCEPVRSAYLQLTSSDGFAASTACGKPPCTASNFTFRVYGVGQSDGPPFTGEAGNTPLDVPYTTAYTDYVTTGPGDDHGSCQGNNSGQNTCTHRIDVTNIVQEIVAQPGWSSSSAMRFVLVSADSTASEVYAGFEDSSANPSRAATLLVNPPAPTIVSSGAFGTEAQATYPTAYATGPFVYPGASTLLLFLGDYYDFYGQPIAQPNLSDSCGNTWNVLAGSTNWAGEAWDMRSTVYVVENPAPCPNGDTITVSIDNQEPIFLHFLAVTGSDTTHLPSVSAIASPPPGTYTATAASGPVTLNNAGLLVSWIFGDSTSSHTFVPASGFAKAMNSIPTFLTAAYRNVPSAGTYQNQFTISPTPDGWQTILVGIPAAPTP